MGTTVNIAQVGRIQSVAVAVNITKALDTKMVKQSTTGLINAKRVMVLESVLYAMAAVIALLAAVQDLR